MPTSPHKTPQEYLERRQGCWRNPRLKMGGTGSKQEDQIITALMEKAAGVKFIYVPYKGGGEVAVQLVGKHVDSTVNNPD
jgi:putative tricarboxylic transport membrane protein